MGSGKKAREQPRAGYHRAGAIQYIYIDCVVVVGVLSPCQRIVVVAAQQFCTLME